jgi:hypothetical protein
MLLGPQRLLQHLYIPGNHRLAFCCDKEKRPKKLSLQSVHIVFGLVTTYLFKGMWKRPTERGKSLIVWYQRVSSTTKRRNK